MPAEAGHRYDSLTGIVRGQRRERFVPGPSLTEATAGWCISDERAHSGQLPAFPVRGNRMQAVKKDDVENQNLSFRPPVFIGSCLFEAKRKQIFEFG
jgi:hypothetical protein